MAKTYFTDAEARATVGEIVEAGSDFPSVPRGTRGSVVKTKKYVTDKWTVVVEWDLPRHTSAVLAMVLDASVNFTKREKPVSDEFCKSEYETLLRVLHAAE